MKKAFKIVGIILFILISAAIAAPLLFHKKILDIAKNEINKNINAQADFNDVDISFFRHFPKVSVRLTNLHIVGKNEFAKDTLLATKGLDISINFLSLFRGSNLNIYGFDLESPRINALVTKEGKANWDIFITSEESKADTASSLDINLQRYAIHDGFLLYKDLESDIQLELHGLEHAGKGDISKDIFTLSTKSAASSFSLTYANIPWLYNVKTNLKTDIVIDNNISKYEFTNALIGLNDLNLNSSGYIQILPNDRYGMDFHFKTPSTDFKNFLSLVPGIYKDDFKKIKTSGNANIAGIIKGIYAKDSLPSYLIDLNVQNGSFQYPSLPKSVNNIALQVKLENPDGKPDNSIIHVSKGHLEMDKEPFDFMLLYKNPETIQYVEARVKGKLNLADVSSFIKLETGTQLSGIVMADAYAKGNLKDLQNQRGTFDAGGFFDVQQFHYASKDFPQPIKNGHFKIQLTNTGGIADNTTIDITKGHLEVGNDPLDFSLKLTKPTTAVNFDGNAKGSFTLDHVKQFVEFEQGTSLTGKIKADIAFKGNKTAINKKEFDQIHFSGTADIQNLKYISKDYPSGFFINKALLELNEANASIATLDANYLNTHFSANGILNNLVGYMASDQTLIGIINIQADKMNLNEWMGTNEDTASVAADPFLVPEKINITINAKADQVKYDKVIYKNIHGSLSLNNETIELQNVKTEALDGSILFNGSYSTRINKKQPDISLTYDVKNINIQKAFYAFNSIQKIMPIGQFLAGKLSSGLTMTGNLKGNMMPELSSLTGSGNFLLIEGVLNKFKPLEKIATTLNIEELEAITIKDIKNYIDFKNGKVLVKPFVVKVKDIVMEIGGMHGFDQSLDYVVQMKVPRKYIGQQGNALINNLVSQANKKGASIVLGETVELKVNLSGKMTDPVVKTDLKEVAGDAMQDLKQQATEFAKEKVDSTKQLLKDSLTSVKKQITADLKDELKKQFFTPKDSISGDSLSKQPLDNVKQKAEQTIKNTLNNLLNKKKKQLPDSSNHN